MSVDYQAARADATAAVQEVGIPAEIIGIERGVRDRWGGYNLDGQGRTVRAVRFDFTISEKANTQIQDGDMKFFVEAEGVAPQTGEKIVFAGGTYTIEAVEPLSPTGLDIFYKLRARRV